MKLSLKSVFVGVVICALMPSVCRAQSKGTLGWVEKVRIVPEDVVVQAKLDTGAENSSIDAQNIEEYEKDGKKWVKFDLNTSYGKTITFQHKVISTARIKKPLGRASKRFVIKLGLCLGDRYMEAEVNLQDRSGYDYPMLIGRSFLAGNVIVDPAIMYTAEPNCKPPK